MFDRRVLVIGTTHDYVDYLLNQYPGRCLFLVEPKEAQKIRLNADDGSVLTCGLTDKSQVLVELKSHLKETGLKLSGIACFDCESLMLASWLARSLGLQYPMEKSIAACRSKYLSKKMWEKAGLNCPRFKIIDNPTEGLKFLEEMKRPVVIKPLTGSGSELVFMCQDRYELMSAFLTMRSRLIDPANPRMYSQGDEVHNPKQVFEIEEFIRGREYSCDFIIKGSKVDIVRIAKKVPADDQPFGTTLAYIVPAQLPEGISESYLASQLQVAAHSLGLDHAICMVDFIIKKRRIYFLELAPRPGGDCLPFLIKKSSGMDILGLTLDLAENKPLMVPEKSSWKKMVGLRLFAGRDGVVSAVNTGNLQEDSRVQEIYIKNKLPFKVTMPPDDYDSYILGHIIFIPTNDRLIEDECNELKSKLQIVMEVDKWATAAG